MCSLGPRIGLPEGGRPDHYTCPTRWARRLVQPGAKDRPPRRVPRGPPHMPRKVGSQACAAWGQGSASPKGAARTTTHAPQGGSQACAAWGQGHGLHFGDVQYVSQRWCRPATTTSPPPGMPRVTIWSHSLFAWECTPRGTGANTYVYQRQIRNVTSHGRRRGKPAGDPMTVDSSELYTTGSPNPVAYSANT